MSDQLKIEIDVSAAKAALENLQKSFQNFATGAEQGAAKAATAVQRLHTATSTAGAGVTIVIAEGAIQVHAGDLDGFKRSEDQIVRSLADKIKRATRRVQ